VTVELTLRKGGELEGTEAGATTDIYFLRWGTGRYPVEHDVTTFDPGQADHEVIPVAKPYLPFRKTLTIS
jgi:hypothetical protein